MSLFLLIETPSSPFGHRYLAAPGCVVGDLIAARYTSCIREGYPPQGKDWVGASLSVTQAAFSGGREASIRAVVFGDSVQNAPAEIRDRIITELQCMINDLPVLLEGFNWSCAKERLVVELPGLEPVLQKLKQSVESGNPFQTNARIQPASQSRKSFFTALTVAICIACIVLIFRNPAPPVHEVPAAASTSSHVTRTSDALAPENPSPVTVSQQPDTSETAIDNKSQTSPDVASTGTEPADVGADKQVVTMVEAPNVDTPDKNSLRTPDEFPAIPLTDEPFITPLITKSNLLLADAARVAEKTTGDEQKKARNFLDTNSRLLLAFFEARYSSDKAILTLHDDLRGLATNMGNDLVEHLDLPRELQLRVFGSEQEYQEKIQRWIDAAITRRRGAIREHLQQCSFSTNEGSWALIITKPRSQPKAANTTDKEIAALTDSLNLYINDIDRLLSLSSDKFKVIRAYNERVPDLDSQLRISRALVSHLSNLNGVAKWKVNWVPSCKLEVLKFGQTDSNTKRFPADDKSDGSIPLSTALIIFERGQEVLIPIEVVASIPDKPRVLAFGELQVNSKETAANKNECVLSGDLVTKPQETLKPKRTKVGELHIATGIFNMPWLKPTRQVKQQD